MNKLFHQKWVEGCNRMDMVVFTSEFTKEGFDEIVYDKKDNRTQQIISQLKFNKPSQVLFGRRALTFIKKQTK